MSLALMVNLDDALSSAQLNGLTLAEQGAYWRLLLYIWQSLNKTGEGLADDDVTLAQLATVPLRTWKRRFGARIKACLTLRNGRWCHARLLEELERYQAKQTDRSAHASHAARARWERRRQPERKPAGRELESAGDVMRSHPLAAAAGVDMPAASIEHAGSMPRASSEQCSEHATSYSVLHTEKRASDESSGVIADRLPNEGANEGPTMTANDVQQARQILQQAARGAPAGERGEPDAQITGKILLAAGGLEPLLQRMAAWRKQQRDFRHVDSYGYFLRVLEAENRARAG